MGNEKESLHKEKRIVYIDLAKGFCIALVVIFHAKGVLEMKYSSDPFFASFRLPLYFFLSGLFFKDYGGFHLFFIKKVNRLLIPFLFFYFCFSVIMPNVLHYFLRMNFDTVVGWPSLWAFLWPGQYPNIPIWFLWCLFLMNVLFYFFYIIDKKMISNGCWVIVVICIVSGVVGNYYINAYGKDFGNVFKALQCMPFFCFGFLFKKYKGLQKLTNMSVSFILLWIVFLFGVTLFLSICYPLFFISGMTGTLLVLFTAKLIGRMPLFSYIGRYSIMVLLTHGLLIRLFTPLCKHLNAAVESNMIIFLLTLTILLSYYLLIPLMRRFLPYVTAQKPFLKE